MYSVLTLLRKSNDLSFTGILDLLLDESLASRITHRATRPPLHRFPAPSLIIQLASSPSSPSSSSTHVLRVKMQEWWWWVGVVVVVGEGRRLENQVSPSIVQRPVNVTLSRVRQCTSAHQSVRGLEAETSSVGFAVPPPPEIERSERENASSPTTTTKTQRRSVYKRQTILFRRRGTI